MGLFETTSQTKHAIIEDTLATKRSSQDKKIDFLLKRYREYLDICAEDLHLHQTVPGKGLNVSLYWNFAQDTVADMTLSRNDAERFVQEMEALRTHPQYICSSKYFISHLIRRAYECGTTEFCFAQKFRSPNNFSTQIHNASILDYFEPTHVTLEMRMEMGNTCMTNLHNCTIIFRKPTGENCGFGLYDSRIEFHDSAGDHSATSCQRSEIYFFGDIGEKCGIGGEECSFFSPREETLHKIYHGWEGISLDRPRARTECREKMDTCSFYLIQPDGSNRKIVF